MSAITPVTSMPADSASPSGMLTTALPQVRVQAKTVTGGAKLTVLQKNEGGVWFRVPQERVISGKSIGETKAVLSLDVGEADEITIDNPFGSTAYHVLQENGGYAGNESGTVTAYIAGATAAVSTGDLSSVNLVASGTLAVTGASTLTGAASLGSTLAVTGASTLTGAASLGSTLAVTGATTLSSTLAVTGASTLTGQLNANGALKLAGTAPAAAADAVGEGVVDINGATTAAKKEVFEGGGTLTRRVYSATGAVKVLYIDEDVADDATITLPVPSSGCVGMLDVASLIEGGKAAIQNDGTCTVLCGSTNFVATNTDAKLCIFQDTATPTIRNRLGATRRILATYTWS